MELEAQPTVGVQQYSEEYLQTLDKEDLIRIILSTNNKNKRSASDAIGSAPPKRAKTVPTQSHPQSSKKPKQQKEMDWSKYSTRHIALKLLYLGWDYHGLAMQPTELPDRSILPTIESEFFAALRKTRLIPEKAEWTTVNYSRSGRTDRGVSGFGQVVALHVRSTVKSGDGVSGNAKELEYVSILNRVLPSDIRILGWAPVNSEFNASTMSRTYKYLFLNPANSMNIEKMSEAAKHLEGEHDFRNFCKLDINVSHWVRSIFSVDIRPFSSSALFPTSTDSAEELENDIERTSTSCFVCTIRGSGFLWHQIRCIMYLLFLVGTGKEEPDTIRSLLDVESNPRKPCYGMGSDLPLILFDCAYEPEIPFQASKKDIENVVELMKEKLEGLAVRSNMLSLVIYSLDTQFGPFETSSDRLPLEKLVGRYIPLMKRPKEALYENRAQANKQKLQGSKGKP